MTNPTTDLAARFEAKRIEAAGFADEQASCYDGPTGPIEAQYRTEARTWAEARDMAHAGAAGGAQRRDEAESVSLAACPIGLFWSNSGELCLKTEYGNNEGRIDAYIVSSGEFFWGDPPQTIGNQRRQSVRPVCWQALSAALTSMSPPPAQQGSSSPPLTAERVDLGELERLSAKASPGLLSLSGSRKRYHEDSCVIIDSPNCMGLFALATDNGKEALEALADARFAVALWNAYRSGHLVPASLPAGTGSAEEGTGLGAPATPSGSQASPEAPSDFRPAGVDPSRVERAAQAAWDHQGDNLDPDCDEAWASTTESARELWRSIAKVMLSAADGGCNDR
jgi:hypothetical protein